MSESEICDMCDHYEGRWCNLFGRSVAYNRVACEHINGQSLNPKTETNLMEGEEDMARRKVEITDKQTQEALKAYRVTRSVSKAAKAAGISDWLCRRLIKEHKPEPAQPELQVVEASEESCQEPEEHVLIVQDDARINIKADLEEAQKALVLLDTIKQVYGEAPELELAVVDAYKRRRRVA